MKFAPTINLNGRTVTPGGWHWILGFALGGCKWAIKIASTEEFRKQIRDDLEETRKRDIHQMIEYYESEIARLKETL